MYRIALTREGFARLDREYELKTRKKMVHADWPVLDGASAGTEMDLS